MKIVALNGLLGYGYSEEALKIAFSEKVDYVGVDGGSTDPGPYYLGSGQSFTNKEAVKRDLALALPLALEHKAPFVVGTSGGSGSKIHLEWLLDIVLEIAHEKDLSFRLGLIYTDVTKEYVLDKLKNDRLIPMGHQIEVTENTIYESGKIVSQIGVAPIIKMLKDNVQVILCGRACDTAIYAAPCLLRGYDAGLAFHMAKIMECGAMCSEPVAAADVMQAYMEKDNFKLRPANPIRRCTVARVAAHTMYEQTNPYLIYEPDGVANLQNSSYIQVDERTVRVSGSVFQEANEKTLKLEGVKLSGYRTVCFCGINDSLTMTKIDELWIQVKEFIKQNMKDYQLGIDYKVNLRKYGAPIEENAKHNMAIIIDVVGKTQAIAGTICALLRARLLHCDYDGRKATAGNLAFPFSPSDIHMGEVYEFNLYHLAKVDDLCETAEYKVIDVEGK